MLQNDKYKIEYNIIYQLAIFTPRDKSDRDKTVTNIHAYLLDQLEAIHGRSDKYKGGIPDIQDLVKEYKDISMIDKI